MDKELRPEGATILRFPVRDADRLAERRRLAAEIVPAPDPGFDIDGWYHQGAIEDARDRAKH